MRLTFALVAGRNKPHALEVAAGAVAAAVWSVLASAVPAVDLSPPFVEGLPVAVAAGSHVKARAAHALAHPVVVAPPAPALQAKEHVRKHVVESVVPVIQTVILRAALAQE